MSDLDIYIHTFVWSTKVQGCSAYVKTTSASVKLNDSDWSVYILSKEVKWMPNISHYLGIYSILHHLLLLPGSRLC